MALKGNAKRAIQYGVDNYASFRAGNVSGKLHPTTKGQLPEDLWEHLQKVHARGELEYVLYSYHTPMAWKVRGMTNWVFPGIYYSVTTNNHQNVMRTAIAERGFYANTRY